MNVLKAVLLTFLGVNHMDFLLLTLRKNLDARTYTIMVKELKKYSVGELSDSDNNADTINAIPTVQN